MITFEQLKKQFAITNMIPVRIPKGGAGQSVRLKVNGVDITATYLTDLKEGMAIALFTDKGNWYLIGEEANTQNLSSKRIIEYRKTDIQIKKILHIKTLFYLFNSDGIRIDFCIGGDRKKATKILSVDRTELIYPDFFNTFSLALGGITNLGRNEMVGIETETTTLQNYYVLRKAGLSQQITFEKAPATSTRFYLGNGAFEASFGIADGENKLIYNSNEAIILPFASTFSYAYDFFGHQLETANFTQTGQTWTPDRLITDYIYIREFVSSSGDSIGSKSLFTESFKGYFLVQKTSEGYITQDFASSGNLVENRLFDDNRTSIELISKETKNILTYFRPNRESLILNNGDFFLIDIVNLSNVFPNGQPPTAKDTTTLTVTFVDYTGTLRLKPPTPDPLYYYEPQYFDPANITGKILFNGLVDGQFGIIKGEITNVSAVGGTTEIQLTLEITITIFSIITNVYTDFAGKILSDNGSFYSYYFRKSLGVLPARILNKSILPLINLRFGGGYGSINLQTDNIVGNKIYSVIGIDKRKAFIMQWDISKNGDIKFDKVFATNYFQPKGIQDSFSQILGHSYHP